MKNILARGGIEFLAVFLGIALSLWVDDYRESKEINNSQKKTAAHKKKPTDSKEMLVLSGVIIIIIIIFIIILNLNG